MVIFRFSKGSKGFIAFNANNSTVAISAGSIARYVHLSGGEGDGTWDGNLINNNVTNHNGTMRNLIIKVGTNTLSADDLLWTVMVKLAPTSLALTIPFGFTGTVSNLVDIATFEPLDLIQYKFTIGSAGAGSMGRCGLSVEFAY